MYVRYTRIVGERKLNCTCILGENPTELLRNANRLSVLHMVVEQLLEATIIIIIIILIISSFPSASSLPATHPWALEATTATPISQREWLYGVVNCYIAICRYPGIIASYVSSQSSRRGVEPCVVL
jgi:hypothetical protein